MTERERIHSIYYNEIDKINIELKKLGWEG